MAGDGGKYNFNRREEIHRRAESETEGDVGDQSPWPSTLTPSLASWGMKHESPGATTPVFRLSRAGNPPQTSPSRIKRNEERTGIIIILVDRA